MENLQVIERENQRVLTTAQIAEEYGTDSNVVQRNFNRNKTRYIEGKHYYCLTGELKSCFFQFILKGTFSWKFFPQFLCQHPSSNRTVL